MLNDKVNKEQGISIHYAYIYIFHNMNAQVKYTKTNIVSRKKHNLT